MSTDHNGGLLATLIGAISHRYPVAMRTRTLTRRDTLGTGLALATTALAGCFGNDDGSGGDGSRDETTGNGDESGATAGPDSAGLERKHGGFRVGPGGPGIEFEPLVDIDGEYPPEGLFYHDGHIYVGERTSPLTIRQYETDGTKTDEEFTFDDLRIDHPNAADWVNGNVWLSDSSTMVTYVVDWDRKEVVDEIAQEGVVTGTWRGVVPTSDGEPKLLFSEWLGRDMWVVDLADARADGTTEGNVDKTLRNGTWTNLQTCSWHDGSLITTTHSWVIKSRLPRVDKLNEGYPVTSYNVEWACEFADGNTLEQAVYNPDDDEYYLADRGGLGTIYVGTERYGPHRNKSFADWPAVEGGYETDYVMSVADERTQRLALTRGFGEAKSGWLEVPFFDEGGRDDRVSVGVVTNGGDAVMLGVAGSEPFGADNYALYDGEEWTDTGVERVPETWVTFGWTVGRSAVSPAVSTDHGRSWRTLPAVTGQDTTVNRLQMQNRTGSARVGDWTVNLRNTDEVY